MSEIDFSKYSRLDEILEDIKTIKIQGATNVAIATFEGLKLYLKNDEGARSYELFIADVERVGVNLAHARPNEPLAKNGLKFVMKMLRSRNPGLNDIEIAKAKIIELCDEYLKLVSSSKDLIVENALEVVEKAHGVLTHCHSSTAERVIISQTHRPFKAVCTETRPLYQGHTTATNLLNAGVDVTLIADSCAESFIVGRGLFPVDVVFLGADEITIRGNAINKIGSWGLALASYFASKPVYILASILKVDVTTLYDPIQIETRDQKEVWPDAPAGLKMYNPAFELVNKQFITGFVTEIGIIKPQDIESVIAKRYDWLF